MSHFINELEVGEIHQRDNLQFELKSEFFPFKKRKKNIYKQEFYLFIPNALQINEDTYSKEQFYRDQTNYIRYKTPVFTLEQLLDPKNRKSPLNRLPTFCKSKVNRVRIEDEIKLFGNIVRSSLREHARLIIEQLNQGSLTAKEIHVFCENIRMLRVKYLQHQKLLTETYSDPILTSHLYYADNFMSNSINYYLSGLLLEIEKIHPKSSKKIDRELRDLLLEEKNHRRGLKDSKPIGDETIDQEYKFYRKRLLNKFVLDALLLSTTRSMVYQKFRGLIGAISAGIAMMFFFVLFVFQGNVFIINSLPFIFITVFLYIIKDRIKESIRILSYKRFHKWFPDYKTEIRSPNRQTKLGIMTESFSFIEEDKIPNEIMTSRNLEFHDVLETFKRPESIIYYKKIVSIHNPEKYMDPRRHALNVIFRFSIENFLKKMDDPTTPFTTVDGETGNIIQTVLPKVYHLNIILKNTFLDKKQNEKSELKKFRLILDKKGIKRLEFIQV